MAFLFDPFSPLAGQNLPESVTFLSTEDFGGGNVIHVRIVGTDLDYNATTGAFGGTAVITAIELVDATGGNVLQTVTLGSTTAAADATAFLAQVAAAYTDFPNLNLPVFDDLEVASGTPTSFRLNLFDTGNFVGYILVTGTGFIDDTLAGTVTSFVHFDTADNQIGALAAVPAPLSALVYPFGAQDGLYYVLTSGDDTVDATAAADGVLNHDLDPGAGTNTISAFFGGTLLTYKESTEAVTIDLGAGTATRSGGDIDTFSNIDLAEGSALDDTLLGSGGNNFLAGRDGGDTLNGNGVTLDESGLGFDVLSGGGGNDTFVVGTEIFLGPATNTIIDYNAEGGALGITVNLDSVVHAGQAAGTATDSFGDTDTLTGVHNVLGTAFGDTFFGSSDDDVFTPGTGDDEINGGGTNDFDILTYAPVAFLPTAFNLTEGIVVVWSGTGSGNVNSDTTTEVGSDTFTGIEAVWGTQFNDQFIAMDGPLYATGMAGDDTFAGGNFTQPADTVNYSFEIVGGFNSGVFVNMSGSAVTIGVTVAANSALDASGGTDTLNDIDNIVGTAFGDIIIGSILDNHLDGLGGGDFVRGGEGDDTLIMADQTVGAFNFLAGDDGADSIDVSGSLAPVFSIVTYEPETGTGGVLINLDTVSHTSTVGAINVAAGKARDTFGKTDTLTGVVNVIGTARNDEMWGGAADEIFNVGGGSDRIHGGGGRDTLFYSFLAAIDTNLFDLDNGLTITLTAQGTGTVAGSALATVFEDAFDGIEVIIGSLFADTFTGAANATNHFGGMDGADTFNGHATSSDTVDYSNDEIAGGGAAILVNLGTVSFLGVDSNRALDGFGNLDTLSSIEHAIGTRFDDGFIGSSSGNLFDGGAGADSMVGLGGNDTYVVDDASDFVNETATGSGGDDLVRSWITFALGTNFERLELLGGGNIDGTGNALNNTITGNSGSNTLDGGDGNDSLAGAGGADTLIGGAGNDTFVLGDGTDSVDDVSGTDTITSTINRSLALFSTIENLILLGTATQGTGNVLRNSITGNTLANLLDGGVNIDTLAGGAGNDTYVVTTGDVLTETSGQGTDTVRASQSYVLASSANIEKLETVSLTATTAINLTGNALAQSITGNNGANKITGGGGKDTMSGKLGKDTFDFNAISDLTKSSSTTDVITDFTKGQDKIDLSTIDASSKAAGNQAFTLLTTKGAAFTGVAGQLHYKALGSNTLIEGDLNGDKKADFALLLLGSKTLAKTDFIL